MNSPVSSDTEIVGISLIIKRKLRFIHKAAKSDKSILILVETGTGKDLTAKKVHELSDRRNKPFVVSIAQTSQKSYLRLNFLAMYEVLLLEL